jgi:DNA-binding FadR family transcriptional regulator
VTGRGTTPWSRPVPAALTVGGRGSGADVTDFTNEDVERGAEAWDALMGNRYGIEAVDELRGEVECILAAVLPEHDKRVRAEALREAADWWRTPDAPGRAYSLEIADWLRALSDAEEGK